MGMDQQASSYRWVVVSVWFVASVAGYMVMSTLGLLLPSITEELHLSPSQQGMLASAAFWGNLALAIPLGWWASRYGPKMLTLVTLALGTVCVFVQGWAPAFAVLLAGRLAFGILLLAREPARALLIRQWFSPREVVVVNSLSNALFGVVVGGGLVATPFILSGLGNDWRLTLYAFGFLLVAMTLLWAVVGREREAEEYRGRREVPQDAGTIKGALKYRDLWLSCFGFLGAFVVWSAFLSFYPTLMLDTYDLSLSWSGGILSMFIVVGGVTGIGTGYVVMKMDKRRVILQSLGVLMVVTCVGMILTDSIPLLLAFSFFNGVAWGFFPILQTVPFHLPGIRSREVAVALALETVFKSTGSVLGPLITGFLHEAFGELRLAMLVVSFSALSLTVAGTLLRFGAMEIGAEPSRAVGKA